MNNVYIIAAKRTAIGRLGGGFVGTSAVDLGATVVKSVLTALPQSNLVGEVILGNVLGAGCGMNVARQVAIGAGLDPSVPAYAVNKVCGSGLKAIALAGQAIRDGEADIVVAGGTENMSQAPYLLPGARYGQRLGDGAMLDAILKDGLTDAFSGQHMALLAERMAETCKIDRASQDAFALSSQQRWAAAQAAGVFADEITPVRIRVKKQEQVVDRDEHTRPDTTIEQLAGLPAAFKKDGTVTAGNASGINDGAAAVLLASEKAVKAHGLRPIGRLVGWASAGVAPQDMGLGPIPAARKLLEKTGRQLADVDLVELNEAFAVQTLACMRELGLDSDKVNVHGGAIAMGHPIGASGARVVVTLLNALAKRGGRCGIATLCIGGGMSMAAMVERV
jgi:acetyl-CoA C-acetyltransferase